MKKEIMMDGIRYRQVEEDEETEETYVMARTYSAGVFAGYLIEKKGREVKLRDARRIWYWKGAASLSQLAVDGTSTPGECKFPVEVPEVTLTEVIELIPISEKARKSIKEVPVWME